MSIAHRAMSISYIELNPMYELWSYHDNRMNPMYEHSSCMIFVLSCMINVDHWSYHDPYFLGGVAFFRNWGPALNYGISKAWFLHSGLIMVHRKSDFQKWGLALNLEQTQWMLLPVKDNTKLQLLNQHGWFNNVDPLSWTAPLCR